MSILDPTLQDPTATISSEILAKLDPEYRDFVTSQPTASRTPLSSLGWSSELRKVVNSSTAGNAEPVPVGAFENIDMGKFSVRVLVPDSSAPSTGWPALLYLHGGGWLFGTCQTGESFYTRACMEARCVVVSVDYRLAPEDTFPAALEDSWAALLWLLGEGGKRYNVNRNLVALCGYSSGANMAAVIAQRATMSRPQIRLCAQVLLMPILDLTLTEDPITWSPSMREHANTLGLYARDVIWSRNLHTPNPRDRDHPDASPLLQDNKEAFNGMARSWIGVAELDVLRSDGERYAKKLEEYGVQVNLKTYYGANHLLIQADAACELARRIRHDQIAALKTAFS